LLLLGSAFLLFTLDFVERGFIRNWWPVALVVMGGVMVFRFFQDRPEAPDGVRGDPEEVHGRKDPEPTVVDRGRTFRVFQMLGGTRQALTSQSFRGGDATAFMGGVEIDLTRASPVPEGARIDATAIMGGVVLHVPGHWDVTVIGAPLLGGVVDKRDPHPSTGEGEPRPRLQVRATVLMGGLEIK
jgi:hypothetical protein